MHPNADPSPCCHSAHHTRWVDFGWDWVPPVEAILQFYDGGGIIMNGGKGEHSLVFRVTIFVLIALPWTLFPCSAVSELLRGWLCFPWYWRWSGRCQEDLVFKTVSAPPSLIKPSIGKGSSRVLSWTWNWRVSISCAFLTCWSAKCRVAKKITTGFLLDDSSASSCLFSHIVPFG